MCKIMIQVQFQKLISIEYKIYWILYNQVFEYKLS